MGSITEPSLKFLINLPAGARVLNLNEPGQSPYARTGKTWPYPAVYFDAVVALSLDRFIGGRQLGAFLREADRVLKENGTLFVTYSNKWGYDNFLNPKSRQKHTLTTRELKRGVLDAGFSHLRRYSLYPDVDEVTEVMGLGDRTYAGAMTIRESFKERILSSHLFPVVAPGHALVALKNGGRAPFIETLLESLKKRLNPGGAADERLIVNRFYLLRGKAIALVEAERFRERSWVIKFPAVDWAFQLMEQEAMFLNRLSEVGIRDRARAPEFYFSGSYEGRAYFVMERKKGVTVDIPTPSLKHSINDAVGVLAQFHRMTTSKRVIDKTLFNNLFRAPFSMLYPHLGNRAADLRKVERIVEEQVFGQILPLVWEHGDFHHENLVVDPQSHAVNGVIDWEMSRENGLPLVDLLYLIARREMLYEGGGFSSVLTRRILPMRLGRPGTKLLDIYRKEVPVDTKLIFSLCVMCWLLRIHRSGGIRKDPAWLEENIDSVVSSIIRLANMRGRKGS